MDQKISIDNRRSNTKMGTVMTDKYNDYDTIDNDKYFYQINDAKVNMFGPQE